MTNGDFAVEAGVDFLGVTEHRLVPARARSEWKRLRSKGISSVGSPASQEFSTVGNAGVGVVSLRSAPLALPTFATPGFERVFWFGQSYSLSGAFGIWEVHACCSLVWLPWC